MENILTLTTSIKTELLTFEFCGDLQSFTQGFGIQVAKRKHLGVCRQKL